MTGGGSDDDLRLPVLTPSLRLVTLMLVVVVVVVVVVAVVVVTIVTEMMGEESGCCGWRYQRGHDDDEYDYDDDHGFLDGVSDDDHDDC